MGPRCSHLGDEEPDVAENYLQCKVDFFGENLAAKFAATSRGE